MDELLYLVCAAAGWLAAGYSLRLYRRDTGNRTRAAVVSALACFAVGITVAVPSISAWIDDLVSLANFAKVFSHLCALGIGFSCQVMLVGWSFPPSEVRRRLQARAIPSVVGVLGLLGFYGVSLSSEQPVELTVEYAGTWFVLAYLAVYIAAFIAYSADIARLCWRYGNAASNRRWLGRGLRLTAVGAVLALGYCAEKAAFLVAFAVGNAPGNEKTVAAGIVTAAALCMIVGVTMPAWGPSLDVAKRTVGAHRQLRALYALAVDMYGAAPAVWLDPPGRPPLLPRRESPVILYQQIVAIKDARKLLAPRPEPVSEVLDQRRKAAEAEAAALCAAIRRTGRLTAEDALAAAEPARFGEEDSWWPQVARAYRTLSAATPARPVAAMAENG